MSFSRPMMRDGAVLVGQQQVAGREEAVLGQRRPIEPGRRGRSRGTATGRGPGPGRSRPGRPRRRRGSRRAGRVPGKGRPSLPSRISGGVVGAGRGVAEALRHAEDAQDPGAQRLVRPGQGATVHGPAAHGDRPDAPRARRIRPPPRPSAAPSSARTWSSGPRSRPSAAARRPGPTSPSGRAGRPAAGRGRRRSSTRRSTTAARSRRPRRPAPGR